MPKFVVPNAPTAPQAPLGNAAPSTTTGDMTPVSVPMPLTSAELPRKADGTVAVGEIVAVPIAPKGGSIDVPDNTPVAVIARDALKSPTVRVGIGIIAGSFAFFIGYVFDQILETRFIGPIPWYLDVLIVGGTGAALIALAAFWNAPIVAKVRSAIWAGLGALFAFVAWTVVTNNGLDGINWAKTFHTGLNFAVVAALGGILVLSKVFDNNPITNLPWAKFFKAQAPP